ncbi:MAG: dihydroorotate dehydrogenase-like protein [Phycisphaerae bacterium]
MDLSTAYMGLKLRSPLVVSASPLSRDIDTAKRLVDAGASAIVMWSLFEEQISHEAAELEHYLEYGTERFAESLTYFPDPGDYSTGPEQYIEHIAELKKAVDVPVIGSLNGVSAGGWTSYARQMQQAGADAVELNVYFLPTSPDATADTIENAYEGVLQAVKSVVDIPVAMKLSPFFSAPVATAKKLERSGADALVLFNRFYQPDIDIENLQATPSLELSRSYDSRLPLRWMAILRPHLQCSLAATSGIHTGRDAAKMLLAGADVAMLCSALLSGGADRMSAVKAELIEVMESVGYESVSQMKGVMSHEKSPEPGAFERANYMKALNSFGWTPTRE